MELSMSEHSSTPKKLSDKINIVLETPRDTATNRDEEGCIPD